MSVEILNGDCLDTMRSLPAGTFQTCVTSPPYYGLRDYGVAGQIGLEPTPDEYIARMVDVFRDVRRVLRDNGTAWVNIGDSYAASGQKTLGRNDAGRDIGGGGNREGSGNPGKQGIAALDYGAKPKDLLGIPWLLAFALRADGWYLRSAIVWAKPNPMPESVRDRPTSAYEHVFLLSKRAAYFYDAEAIAEDGTGRSAGNTAPVKGAGMKGFEIRDGFHKVADKEWHSRNARNVWTIATQPYSGAHFATMPPELAERCIKAGSRAGDHVLDPFGGAGTTGLVADRLGRSATLCEMNPEYARLARERITADAPLLAAMA